MSVSRHPVALRLEQQVGGATKLLATVMALPLVDGIFPALVIAGVLASPAGIIETGILIFGGSATVAVILAEMDGTRREMATSILLIGAVIIPVAAVQAALAPTLEGLLDLEVFERFAGLVILAIAAKTASSEFGEYLPSPGVIIAFGLIASFSPSGAALEVSTDYVVAGATAAGIGTGFALSIALLSPQLKGRVHIDRFRFGSAVALGVLALPILLGPLMETEAPIALAVLAVTALFAYDPDADPEDAVAGVHGSDPDDPDGGDDDTPVDVDDAPAPSEPPAPSEHDTPSDAPTPAPRMGNGATAAAGGADADADPAANGGPTTAADDDHEEEPFSDSDSRAPWL
ncbi:DUF5794 domain-containing protein [Halorubrum gandharaense]